MIFLLVVKMQRNPLEVRIGENVEILYFIKETKKRQFNLDCKSNLKKKFKSNKSKKDLLLKLKAE